MHTIIAFEDPEITAGEKQGIMLANTYYEVPQNTQQAIEKAVWFLNGGDIVKDSGDTPRVYSFEKDSKYIFAAFQQTHGINLQTANLHWFEFLALFLDLGQDTAFSQIRDLRYKMKTGKATKEERQAAKDMGDLLDIPEVYADESIEEREAHEKFLRAIGAIK